MDIISRNSISEISFIRINNSKRKMPPATMTKVFAGLSDDEMNQVVEFANKMFPTDKRIGD